MPSMFLKEVLKYALTRLILPIFSIFHIAYSIAKKQKLKPNSSGAIFLDKRVRKAFRDINYENRISGYSIHGKNTSVDYPNSSSPRVILKK